ncbi:hypothetical protein [Streptomyces sp. NPDC059788]|uniref:hypothetical protein n=1 Tax=Streptomyces sp. NPDC059788 TaxID=3346948 RepID=UPI00365EBD52
MNPSSPRARLRQALLCIGESGSVPDDLGTAVVTALRELAVEELGERSRVELFASGAEDHSWGRNFGLRLADYDIGLPDLLLYADSSDLPPQVQESCPTLIQEEWEAALLVSKLIITGLESEPVPVPVPVPGSGARHPEGNSRPARSVAREQLCRALTAIAERADLHQDELTAGLRRALLDFASETPDNVEAVQHITVLYAGQPEQGARLCLSPSGVAFSQVILSADGCPVPSDVLEKVPDLTLDEWHAVIQVTGLTLLAFEAEAAREEA